MANMSAKFDEKAHNGLVSIVSTSLFPYMSIMTLEEGLLKTKEGQRQKGGDLTQSYDQSPYTNRNVKGAKWQHKQRHKKVRLNSNCWPT